MNLTQPLQPILGNPQDAILITHKYKPFILFDLDLNTRMAFIVLLALAWVLAMAGKFTIFKMLFRTGFTPINVLIFFYQIVDIITRSIHIPSIIVLMTNKPMAAYVGSDFCSYFHATVINGFGLRSYGSLGISLMRIIYVKHQDFIVGKRYMEWVICLTLIVLIVCWTSFLLHLYLMVTSARAYLKEMCYGYNSEFLLILLEYTGAVTETWLHRVLIVSLIIPHFVTAALYSMLFTHLYKHDQSMSKFLSQQAITNRNRMNAISWGCEIYGYGIDVLMYMFFMLTQSADLFHSLRPHSTIFWQFEFAIKSSVQAMAGTKTRTIFLHILRKADIFGIEFIVLKIVNSNYLKRSG